jgi:dTDP-4-amino-4,6-dideoxygalactose transaminase
MLRLSTPHLDESAIDAAAAVLRSGRLVHGEQGNAFEEELAAFLKCRDVVLCSSGTAALHLALLAADIGPGDAVLVPDFSFPASGNVVRAVGAQPVLVDVDPRRYVITAATLADAIARWKGPQKLRAVMPVHEFGCPVDMDAVGAAAREAGLVVIEDAACAIGADWRGRSVGRFGAMGCFSMHPRKTLTTGEGGFITTENAALATRLRRLRNHGMTRVGPAMNFREVGLNYRLTDFQAAIGRTQLPHVRGWIAQRRELARQYHETLSFLASEGVITRPANDVPGHSWQTYMVVLEGRIDRGRVLRSLAAQGIEAGPGAQGLSDLAPFEDVRLPRSHASRLAKRGIALPFCERYGATEVEQVVAALQRAIAGPDDAGGHDG